VEADRVFSGIVAEVGKVRSVLRKGTTVSFRIAAPGLAPDLKTGDSVAVNGVCQTVTGLEAETFTFDSVAQTLKTTNLSDLRTGSPVNLEPALRLGDRVSGHLVSGHVDATAVIRSRRVTGYRNMDFKLQVPENLRAYIHERGSIALDGVSLTVKALHGSLVEITVIPFTLDSTILKNWHTGTRVNVEVDQIARYVTLGLHPKGGGKA
jgi:riboflavin synthase